MTDVALLRCEEYHVESIEKSLREGFSLLGGDAMMRKLIPAGASVLLKPNLLGAEPKGSAVVTDYRIFEAVIRVLKDYTGHISFGDSPGFGGTRKAAETTGLSEVAKRYGVPMADFDDWVVGKVPDPLLVPQFDVARAALEADVLISLPRLKTHGMMNYTGAIKNQFGCISGLKKASWHSRMPRSRDFSRMLLDLNSLVGTDFAILDGIVAMEGNGPKSGTPKQMNTLIMGESISAVDSLAATLIGYDPLDVPYLKQAHKHHWGPVLLKDIRVLGKTIEEMTPESFQLVRGRSHMHFSGSGPLNRSFVALLAPRPVLVQEKCISCQQCGKICPERPHVIDFPEGFPRWDYSKCISCFCCQEICPKGAILVRYPRLARILRMDR